jgi:hypothetical protein
LFTNVTQRDGATIARVHRQKALLLQSLDDMVDNPFPSQLAAKLRIRFTTTADDIFSRDGHEEYCRYVVSWGSEDPSLSHELRAAAVAAEFAKKCRDIREKITGDAVLLLAGDDPEAIGAAFDAFLRHESFWLPGENSVLVGSVFVLSPRTMDRNSWRPWRLSTPKCPRERLQLNDFFQLSREYGASTGWIRAADDLIRSEMIIKHALLHHLKMILTIVSELRDD